MNKSQTIPGIEEQVRSQLQNTLDDLARGVRHPDKIKAACERMDRMREENRKLFGEQNAAVDLIREAQR
jgi:hypothetical protein